MINLFVKRPATTFIFISIFVVLGIVSYFNLIVESIPRIDFPIVTIKTIYPGASPIEIETQIVKKVEDAVAEISQIKNIKTNIFESFSIVAIEFKIEADVNIKAMEVKDKIEMILNDLPDGAKQPVIAKFDPLIKPIADLVLIGNNIDGHTLYEYADKKLKSKLTVIEGIASVDLAGGKKRQINIRLDNTLMLQYYFTIADIIAAVKSENINIPGGTIDKANSKLSLRFIGEFESLEQIKNLKLVSREGAIVKLSDIATIEDSHKKIDSIARFNGKEVITLSLKKLSDGNAISIIKNVRESLNLIRNELPKGMELSFAFDSTIAIIKDTNQTIINIGIGILLTIAILLIFLGDIRAAIIASIVIPTSIISTMFVMDKSGFTINIMTLLAFGTCLGTLIANALVIIESVYLHLERGKKPTEAAIDGTKEVFLAVIAASGTNLVVFTPLSFMGGMIGPFMNQFGLTVVYATLFSILASLSLTPMLCGLLLKKIKPSRFNVFGYISRFVDKVMIFLLGEYKKVYNLISSFPKITIALSIALFFTIIFPARYLGFELMSRSDEDVILIDIEMPDGTPLLKTKDVVIQIESLIKVLPEVKSYLSNIGVDGDENARITVNLKDADKRLRSDDDIINVLIPHVSKIPEANIYLAGAVKNNDGLGDVTINIFANNFDEMVSNSEKMKRIMEESGYFRVIKSSYKKPKKEIRFFPDKNKMINQGVTNIALGMSLRNLVNGNDSNIYKEKSEEYKINIELANEYKESTKDFKRFGIFGKHGLISIGSLGDMKQVKATSPLKRRDKIRIVQLNGYLSKSTAGKVRPVLDEKFSEIKFSKSAGYKHAGRAEMLSESSMEIVKAFALAVIFTYMLLVAILNSFSLPFSIASSIVTSFLGVFLLLFYLELSINIGSMMAFVMLAGLTVNNAILIIDYALQQMKLGKDCKDAIWIGLSVKFKPVIMTSIAIIAGTFPQLLDPFKVKSSMGAVIVGGMLGSIVFTYYLVPAVFIVIDDLKLFFKKIRT